MCAFWVERCISTQWAQFFIICLTSLNLFWGTAYIYIQWGLTVQQQPGLCTVLGDSLYLHPLASGFVLGGRTCCVRGRAPAHRVLLLTEAPAWDGLVGTGFCQEVFLWGCCAERPGRAHRVCVPSALRLSKWPLMLRHRMVCNKVSCSRIESSLSSPSSLAVLPGLRVPRGPQAPGPLECRPPPWARRAESRAARLPVSRAAAFPGLGE